MSQKELHDYLSQLKLERNKYTGDLINNEQLQQLDEVIDSLEQQALFPEEFDQYSGLSDQIQNLYVEMETDHPVLYKVLEGIHEVLNNFRS